MTRMSWPMFVDKTFWILLLAVFSYSAKQLNDLENSTSKLNDKLGIVISTIAQHEIRLNYLEKEKN